jgi:uncharacterized protein YgbK (DUF1537 family)
VNEERFDWSDIANRVSAISPDTSASVEKEWLRASEGMGRKIVVLDDDPTGVQTVHSIPVYTSWDKDTLTEVLREEGRLVYILTNSRALTEQETTQLHREFARNLDFVMGKDQDVWLVSRSDSTLRGHYPLETEILRTELHHRRAIDGEIIVPFFQEGGRITIDDVHYLKEGQTVTPVGMTEFAKNPVFGYRSSNLAEWVEEKTKGKYRSRDVTSIPLDLLREVNIGAIVKRLEKVRGFNKIVVNAVDYFDLKVFFVALTRAIDRGKWFLFRSAASFVSVAAGLSPKPLLTHRDLYRGEMLPGPGLIIVGSIVNKTSRQLENLLKLPRLIGVEFDVAKLEGEHSVDEELRRVIGTVERAMKGGDDACVFTTRADFHSNSTGATSERRLNFAQRVSMALVRMIQNLAQRPGFLVAKGGITSSDIGVKALGVKRAKVLGQIEPGVPVWEVDEGSRFPGCPYVIFPGNVGGDDTLRVVVEKLRGKAG